MARRTAPIAPVAPIDLLAQYDLQEEIGTGDRARVYLARDRVLDHIVAVKLLHERFGGDAALASRLYHTARAAASLGHPGIVAVYDHGPHDGSAFITMEYVAGANLADLLGQAGPFAPRRAVPLIARVLDTLSAAHAYGIAHGDLHPRNILLRQDGGDGVVLTDFGMGLAAVRPAATGTEGGDAARPYRAPELGPGEPATIAGDIYAAGIILYELLAGQRPTPQANRRPAAISRLLFATIQQAIAADPAERHPSAAALREALARVGGVAVPPGWVAAPEGPLEAAVRVAEPSRPRPPQRRNAYRAAAVVVAGALAVSGLVGAAALVELGRPAGDTPPTVAVESTPETPDTPAAGPEEPTPASPQSAAPPATPTPAPTVTPTRSAPAAALAPNPSTPPVAGLIQAPTPTSGPRPTATVGTPRVVASGGTGGAIGVSLENFSPYMLRGAYQPLDVRRKGQPQVALYGVGSGYDNGTLTFEVEHLPTGQITLVLTGLDDERATHSAIEILLNGARVYAGQSTFNNLPFILTDGDLPWDQMRLSIPRGTLLLGTNTLVIRNTSPGMNANGPYILIKNVEFASEGP